MNPLIDRLRKSKLSVTDLNTLYLAYGEKGEFVRWAISAMEHLDADEVWHSLWLLRQTVRAGVVLTQEDLCRVIEMADGFEHWLARLNFCQLMAAVQIPEAMVDEALPVFHAFTHDRLPIVRAWAISALYPLRSNSSHGPKIRNAITRLKKEQSKAIQARIRQLQKAQPGGMSRHRRNVRERGCSNYVRTHSSPVRPHP